MHRLRRNGRCPRRNSMLALPCSVRSSAGEVYPSLERLDSLVTSAPVAWLLLFVASVRELGGVEPGVFLAFEESAQELAQNVAQGAAGARAAAQ